MNRTAKLDMFIITRSGADILMLRPVCRALTRAMNTVSGSTF